MAKNSNYQTKKQLAQQVPPTTTHVMTRQEQEDAASIAGMKALLFGFVAEMYVLIVRRFYNNGTMNQVVAWDGYLVVLGWIGVAALVAGAALYYLKRKENHILKTVGAFVAAGGAFIAAVSFLAHWNQSTVVLFTALVPAVTFLTILWFIYERACFCSLTVLIISMIALWIYRHMSANLSYGNLVKAGGVIWLVVLVVLAYLLWSGKLTKILPDSEDPLPIYISCALAAISMLVGLFNVPSTYYSMWTLALVAFGLSVYYTVKQL